MPHFRLVIELGNDAMCENADVAEALAQVSNRIAEGGLQNKAQTIYDINGNRVGQWKVYDDEA